MYVSDLSNSLTMDKSETYNKTKIVKINKQTTNSKMSKPLRLLKWCANASRNVSAELATSHNFKDIAKTLTRQTKLDLIHHNKTRYMLLDIQQWVTVKDIQPLDGFSEFEIETKFYRDNIKGNIWSIDGQVFLADRALYDWGYGNILTTDFVQEFPRVRVEGPIIQEWFDMGTNQCTINAVKHRCSIMLNHDAV